MQHVRALRAAARRVPWPHAAPHRRRPMCAGGAGAREEPSAPAQQPARRSALRGRPRRAGRPRPGPLRGARRAVGPRCGICAASKNSSEVNTRARPERKLDLHALTLHIHRQAPRRVYACTTRRYRDSGLHTRQQHRPAASWRVPAHPGASRRVPARPGTAVTRPPLVKALATAARRLSRSRRPEPRDPRTACR